MHPAFAHDTFLVRRKVLKLFGGAFHIYDPQGNLVLFSAMKAFKLKEDIRLFTDESQTTELVKITARSIIDFGATYDVVDPTTGEKLGALRRKGLKSILKDEWLLLDTGDIEVGTIAEDSWLLSTIRRFVPMGNLVPQSYAATVGGRPAASFKQNFNPFVLKITVTFPAGSPLDKRLGLAACILLAAIEGRQQ